MISNFKGSFKGASSLAKDVTRRQLTPLLILFLIGTIVTMQGDDLIQGLTPDQESSRWMVQAGMGLWDLFEGVLSFLVLSWGVAKVRDFKSANFEPHPFREGYVGNFLAEYLRMMAQVLLYFLLLIIPALIRYCRLIFMPYIALFSKHYREDKVDAVELSVELTRRYFWLLIGFFLASTVVQAAFEFLPNMVADLHSVPFRVFFAVLSFAFGIWCYCFVFLLFERALEEKTWT
jgi:hypothetical protein